MGRDWSCGKIAADLLLLRGQAASSIKLEFGRRTCQSRRLSRHLKDKEGLGLKLRHLGIPITSAQSRSTSRSADALKNVDPGLTLHRTDEPWDLSLRRVERN